MTIKKAQLNIVGCGLHPGHMTLETESLIKTADLVLLVAPNPLSITHIQSLNKRVEHLGRFYGEDIDRAQIYQKMADEIVCQVKKEQSVCVVFYGHPGIFVLSTHMAREQLLEAGYPVKMYPGISADACLFADLGLDPASTGCQSYEATQFLLTRRTIDTGAALILWQIGLVGEHTLRLYQPASQGLQAITQLLLQDYPADHPICIYEAPTLPGFDARMEWCSLSDLPAAQLKEWSTLLVPAATQLTFASERVDWLGLQLSDFEAWQ